MTVAVLVELTGVSGAGATTRTLRYATHAFTTAPTDTPANTHYEERVLEVPTVRVDLFDGARTSGRSQIGYGVLKLANADGLLDAEFGYAASGGPVSFDGQAVRILVGNQGAPYSSFAVLFKGTAAQVVLDADTVTVRLRDRTHLLDVPLQRNRYGGTNALPAGVDGTSEIAGRVKPWAVGLIWNASPVLVNTARLTYQLNDGPIDASANIRDAGVTLAKGAVYTDLADLEANAPAAGTARLLPALGLFRLGSPAAGTITADFTGVNPFGESPTAATAIRSVAAKAFPSLPLDLDSIGTLHTAVTDSVGVHVDDDRSALDVLDDIASSVVSWYYFAGPNAVLRAGRLQAPGVAPADLTGFRALDENNIIELAIVAAQDAARGAPPASITYLAAKNLTQQRASDLAASVTPSARAGFELDYLRARATVAGANAAQYPLAIDLEVQTVLAGSAGALTQANYDATLRAGASGRPPIFLEVLARDPDPLSNPTPQLHDVVSVSFPRYGLTTPRAFRVLSTTTEQPAGTVRMTLWG